MYAIYNKIAFYIDGDNGGGELEERENSTDFSSVFFSLSIGTGLGVMLYTHKIHLSSKSIFD